jgi:transposase
LKMLSSGMIHATWSLPLLAEPVADRPNWTTPRLRSEIMAREGVQISRAQLSKALRKKSIVGGVHGTR